MAESKEIADDPPHASESPSKTGESPRRVLDYGGAENLSALDKEFREVYRLWLKGELPQEAKDLLRPAAERMFNGFRAVQIARARRDWQVILYDASTLCAMYPEFHKSVPNLHVVIGETKFDENERGPRHSYLPFADESMDVVEMNILASPLQVRDVRAALRRAQIAENDTQSPAALEIRNKIIKLPGDSPQLFHALQEAARVLKPGGILSICDRFGVLEKMQGVLGWDPQTNLADLRIVGPELQKLGFSKTEAHQVTEADFPISEHTGVSFLLSQLLQRVDPTGDTMGKQVAPWIVTLTKSS